MFADLLIFLSFCAYELIVIKFYFLQVLKDCFRNCSSLFVLMSLNFILITLNVAVGLLAVNLCSLIHGQETGVFKEQVLQCNCNYYYTVEL